MDRFCDTVVAQVELLRRQLGVSRSEAAARLAERLGLSARTVEAFYAAGRERAAKGKWAHAVLRVEELVREYHRKPAEAIRETAEEIGAKPETLRWWWARMRPLPKSFRAKAERKPEWEALEAVRRLLDEQKVEIERLRAENRKLWAELESARKALERVRGVLERPAA